MRNAWEGKFGRFNMTLRYTKSMKYVVEAALHPFSLILLRET